MAIIKHKTQRVGVFIDTQNIYHSAKNLYHAKANFGAILKEVIDGRILVRAIAYVASTEGGEEKSFFERREVKRPLAGSVVVREQGELDPGPGLDGVRGCLHRV